MVEKSAWHHALLAFAASMFGLIASYLYLVRSESSADPWALKMALHMAGWHLLLVLTLFPASLLGGIPGARAVQVVAVVFFAIHVAIALANTDVESLAGVGAWIAAFNALSGLFFFATALYRAPVHGR